MTKVTRTCRCGKQFQARQADVNRGWAKSCSKACAAKKRETKTHAFVGYLHKRRKFQGEHGEPDLSMGDKLPRGYVGSWTDEYGNGCFNDAHLFSNEEHDCNKD